MRSQGKNIVFVLFVFFFFISSPFIYSQENTYLLDKKLLEAIQNEVSGERAWDMVSKITRFHRIRGGGEGSDYQ